MQKGTLYIIASPIGNLEDITLRAIRILKEETDLIYCEDTRRTKKLLVHLGTNIPLISLHSHSSDKKITSAITHLNEGKNVSYLTDSGTPGVSDPGSRLISESVKSGIKPVPVPGPSALASIISVSGFPGKNIIFTGFLSKKDGKRRKELESMKNTSGSIVIYESPHRIKKLLSTLNEIFPESSIVIGREITKIHEEFIYGKISDICCKIDDIKEKGEFTIAIYNEI